MRPILNANPIKNTLVLVLLLFVQTLRAQNPVANFSATPLSGCSPLVVNFQNLSSGATSYSWAFGNGNTSTLQNPTATYFAPGTYTVSLTATNVNGSHTVTKSQYITVYEPPNVTFQATNRSGCFPLRTQFTDQSTPGAGNVNTNWLWDFGDGSTSTLQNPLHSYIAAGNFTVTLRVTNDKGCVKTFTRPNYINVTNGVKASFTKTLPTVCGAPANIRFTNTTTGPAVLSYSWNFGDGSPLSNAVSPIHTYTANGTYTATLVATSTAGCQDTAFSGPIVIGGFNTAFTISPQSCADKSVTFTNTSNPTPASSIWRFGDGGTATTLNATHTYTAPGVYTVWLINNYTQCRDSISQQVTVNANPVADFTAPVTGRCEPPFTANFQDISTGGAAGWQWDFGDGGTSTLQNPSHTYTSYGTYTVTLIVTSTTGCTDTIVKPDYIRVSRADISITGLPARGCIPFVLRPIPVINAVDAVTSYQWDFGDGGTSNVQLPTHVYTVQGLYTVRLIITTSTGCRDTLLMTDAVRVGSKPVANFSGAPTPVCARQPVQFTDLSAPADEWFWDFGDGGTSTLQNPSYAYQDTGYFDVMLIAYNNGCPDTIIRNNYIYVLPPVARFTVTPDCTNRLRFTFTDNSIAPQTWEWNFGDGSPVSNVQNPIHIFPSLGTYNVRLVVTNGGCSDTTTVEVKSLDANPDFTANRTTACHPSEITFTASNVSVPDIVNYFWDFGDGNTINTSTPVATHTYTISGSFNVTLTVTDLNGCVDTRTKNAYIRINGPEANFNAPVNTGCQGLNVVFNDLSTNDGVNSIVSWHFIFGDGNSQTFTAPPFQHVYSTVGSFSVRLIVTDALGCKDTMVRFNHVIITDPVPNFTSPDTLTCPGGSVRFNNTSVPGGTGLTHLWTFGDGNTSTTASPTHVYATSGLYTVKLRVRDVRGCMDSLTRVNYIRVERPVPNFTVNDSLSSCLPFEVKFTNTSQYYATSLWDFGPGEGSSTLVNPVHYYSQPGTFPVKLIVYNPGGCRDSIIKTIRVYDTLGSRVNYTPITGCSPLNANFNTATAGQMTSYFWDFGDGTTTTSTTPNINHVYTSFGKFLPSVIMEDPTGCLIPLRGLDTVRVSGATANFGADSLLFCDRATVTFIDSTTFNDPVVQYSWNFGDGNTSNLQNPVHTYTSPGLYNVQLAIQTSLGCRDTLVKSSMITIVQRPLVDIGGDTSICMNESLLHTGLFIQPDTSVVTWIWQFPNGNTSTLQNPPPQVYSVPGTFTVTGIATNSTGCRDTTTQVITVHALPTITIPGQMTIQSGFPVTIPATYSPNVVSWVWSPSTGLSCGDCPTPTAEPTTNTTYQVYFTDNNGCSNIGEVQVLVICKNANLFMPNTFSPNGDGSNDVFYPRGHGLDRVKHLRIFNRWGEVVFERTNFQVNQAASGWNGMFRGKKAQADVYVYQIEVFCDNGEVIRINGNVALIL